MLLKCFYIILIMSSSILLLTLFSGYCFSYPQDSFLSDKLNLHYKEIITKTEIGKEFYLRFEEEGKKFPKILIRYSKGGGLAYYVPQKDSIYLNSKYIRIFFGIKGYGDEKIIKAFNTDEKIRKEFVSYSDGVYLHELVHAFQNRKYGKTYYMQEGKIPLEFEYEAFFLSDLYFYEKVKQNRKLFYDLLSGKYWDVYTGSDLAGFLKISMDPKKYKDEISLRYTDEMSGYVALSMEETRKKAKAEESRILSFAGAKGFEKEKKDLEEIEKQKKEYEEFVKDFYEKKWPKFAAQSFFYTLEVSTQAKNFSLALSLASEAEKNMENYDISQEEKERVKRSCALVFLQSADYLRDNLKKLSRDNLFYLFYNLDRASFDTGRQFPQDLIKEKEKIYKKNMKKLLKEREKLKNESEIKDLDDIIKFVTDSLSLKE